MAVAQSLGQRELTVVLRRVTSVPGPMQVDIVTHRGSPAGELELSVVPTGTSSTVSLPAPGAAVSRTTLPLGPEPGSYGTSLDVDRAGPWELVVDDGDRVARIPFVVAAHNPSPAEFLVYAGFITAGGLILASGVLALVLRRGWGAGIPAVAAVAAIAMAVTAAALSASTPAPPAPGFDIDATVDNVEDPYDVTGPPMGDHSRPPVALVVDGRPVAGVPSTIELRFADTSTGLIVDDLLVHDGALVHLLLVGPTGELEHLHPVRSDAGVYEVVTVLPVAGHYAVSAEVARRGGGIQQVRHAAGIDATGAPGLAAGVPVEPLVISASTPSASATTDDTAVTITAAGLVSGGVSTVTLSVGDVGDLQLWLGMLGHLVVAGPLAAHAPDDTGGPAGVGAQVSDAGWWAHAHSMGSMAHSPVTAAEVAEDPGASGHHGSAPVSPEAAAPDHSESMIVSPTNGDSAPDETVAAYGPDVGFSLSFPQPGRYLAWLQFERGFHVSTVPVEFYVAAPGGTP